MLDADFNQKLANWENGLLNRYLDSLEGPDEDEVPYEPDPDRFRDDPDYEPYYGD